MRISIAFTHTFDSPEKITREECQSIANTFWSGSAEGYFVKVSHVGGNCDIEAYYLGEARHAFYSLDESGHLQVRAPMVYLNQIFASSEANVDAQILATMDEVGYVLTDISAGLGREALEELSHLPETIRLIATPL